MIKRFLPILLLFALVACGAPDEEPVEIEVTRIVEVAGEPEIVKAEPVIIVVTATLPAPEPQTEFGVLYFQLTQNTVLWEQVNNSAKNPLFKKVSIAYNVDDIVVVYNGRGEGEEAEFYIVDGHLAQAEASFPNAQQFVCVDGADFVYPDPQSICEEGQERTALFPGLWSGKWLDADGNAREGELTFYKVAEFPGSGYFIRADHGFLPSCETATDKDGDVYFVNFSFLSVPESCQQ